MKIITYSQIGYNTPSNANWSYRIYKIDTIDTEKSYCNSYTVASTFGGDQRLRKILADKGFEMLHTKDVYPSPIIKGALKMQDIESPAFIQDIVDFMQK